MAQVNNKILANRDINKRKLINSSVLSVIYGVGVIISTSAFNNKAHAELRVIENKSTNVVNDNHSATSSSPDGSTSAQNTQWLEDVNSQAPKTFITQIGINETELEPLKGFAKDLPLIDVLKQITPNGWSAKKKGIIDTSKSTSWAGGKNWVDTLTNLAQEYKFSAKIDWNNKELIIMPPIYGEKIAKIEKNCDSVLGSASTFVNLNKKTDSKIDDGCKVALAGPKSWKLNSLMSLKENVEAWAKQSNWNVMWLGVNYPIDFDTVLMGEFEDEEGPIAQLSAIYEKSKQPLVFDLKYGNRTLVVKNLDFEQRLFKENIDSIGVQNK